MLPVMFYVRDLRFPPLDAGGRAAGSVPGEQPAAVRDAVHYYRLNHEN